MAKPKVTPWFPRDLQPVRRGVYERKFLSWAYFAKWDGRWFCSWGNIKDAEEESSHSEFQSLPWRGLASDPRAAK